MMASLQDRIDTVLQAMEDGSLSVESCLEQSAEEQPVLLDYLFQDEHDFLTSEEKNQLVFLYSILWNVKLDDLQIKPEQLEEIEEQLWEESEKNDFPYSSAHPSIEGVDDEIFALIMDCSDEEMNGLTTVGAKWIQVKGFVLAAVMTANDRRSIQT